MKLDEKLPIACIRRAFDHCLRFLNRYRVGSTDAVLEYALKKYKSHHRLRPLIDLFTMGTQPMHTDAWVGLSER